MLRNSQMTGFPCFLSLFCNVVHDFSVCLQLYVQWGVIGHYILNICGNNAFWVCFSKFCTMKAKMCKNCVSARRTRFFQMFSGFSIVLCMICSIIANFVLKHEKTCKNLASAGNCIFFKVSYTRLS